MLLRPKRITKKGLVAQYDFVQKNLLKYSEDFSNAAWSKANLILTGGFTSPVNDNNAYKTEATTTDPYVSQVVSIGMNISNLIVALSIWVKGEGNSIGKAVDLYMRGTTSNENETFQRFTLSGDWQRLVFTKTFASGLSSTGIHARVELVNSNPQIGDIVYIYGAQLEGGTATSYEKTTDNQTLIDKSGNGYHGQLGSTTGTDTNDPTWSEQGLRFGNGSISDDYVLINTASTTERTLINVVIPEVLDATTRIFFSSRFAPYDTINTTNRFRSSELFNNTQRVLDVNVSLIENQPYFVASRRGYGIFDLFVGNNKRSYTPAADIAYMPDLMTFKLMGSWDTSSLYFVGYMCYSLLFGRVLSESEINHIYTYLKKRLFAKRGVLIA